MNISVQEEYLREDVESRLLISVFVFFLCCGLPCEYFILNRIKGEGY